MAQAARAEHTEELSEPPTIFALSSGAPPAAIAVVRASGPRAFAAMRALAGRLPPPRVATLVTLREGDQAIDQALALIFPADSSPTGEDLVEFHLHGGRATVARMLAALGGREGFEPAAPGAFTRRAFANGRIDLAEAESLGDLLAAETESQRRAAMAGVGGTLSRRIEAWAARLLALSARVEAQIDYAEEGDVGEDLALSADVAALASEMATALAAPPAERLRDGIRVVIAGPPNVGKSSLFNALVGREAAIVGPIAGTTRDLIEAPVAIEGIPFVLVDLAGLRDAPTDPIETIGIARARDAIAVADLVVWLGDDTGAAPPSALLVRARADLPARMRDDTRLAVSAHTGLGLTGLNHELARAGRALLPSEGEVALNRRQRECVTMAVTALAQESDIVLVAEGLRRARLALDRMLGRMATEDMLDALFARFCVGK